MTKVLGMTRHQRLREAIGVTCDINDRRSSTARSSAVRNYTVCTAVQPRPHCSGRYVRIRSALTLVEENKRRAKPQCE
eukprot:15981978-Heterocapsa_arctica.AAC.1